MELNWASERAVPRRMVSDCNPPNPPERTHHCMTATKVVSPTIFPLKTGEGGTSGACCGARRTSGGTAISIDGEKSPRAPPSLVEVVCIRRSLHDASTVANNPPRLRTQRECKGRIVRAARLTGANWRFSLARTSTKRPRVGLRPHTPAVRGYGLGQNSAFLGACVAR